jgi:3-deoxy-manno-octulosonate cytidylyltransferase (CMP-KDO synthetase)
MNTPACLIPARYNSSRFPGKLLAMALGKTVLERTIGSALDYFDAKRVFVATDDERIFRHAEALGVTPIWTSVSCPSGTDRIAEAVLQHKDLMETEIIVNLQGDHPFTPKQMLHASIMALEQDPTASMSTVATKIHRLEDFLSPHVVKVVVDKQQNALYFSRSPIPYSKDTIPPNALHHQGLYCFRRRVLLQYPHIAPSSLHLQEDLEQLKILENGWKIKVAIVEAKVCGVDVPNDLFHLEELLRQHVN